MSSGTHGPLAIDGGDPIRSKPWPIWPRADAATERAVIQVLHSGRWAISGMCSGVPSVERQFAAAFANHYGVPYAVPVCNGSAALVVALQALGVRYGDEVLVPGITWVACASAVARVGAVPILVDVESTTLCMSLEAAKRACTARTRAILIVHLYCSAADIAGFSEWASANGIALLEDCSQAHGARWKGQLLGTFGDAAAFSLQDSKLLTCGEGGIVITRSSAVCDRLQQFRADGRVFTAAPRKGHPELEEVGTVQGHNYCLSEIHAAVALDRLQHLEAENAIRRENARYLGELLEEVGGVTPLERPPQISHPTYYHYALFVSLEEFGSWSIESIRQSLEAELEAFIEPVDTPLNGNLLYNPLRSPRLPPDALSKFDPAQFSLPAATAGAARCLLLSHRMLLGDRTDIEDIAAAFARVQAFARSKPGGGPV
jgi:dTDP-4-amino-4,6-dideoxygalactose transaminase